MTEKDDEALKLCAEAFEKLRLGALACIFWEDLREGESGVKPPKEHDELDVDQCSVM